jgi:hypothetical protein
MAAVRVREAWPVRRRGLALPGGRLGPGGGLGSVAWRQAYHGRPVSGRGRVAYRTVRPGKGGGAGGPPGAGSLVGAGRQRAVLTTVADVIVAAAAGRDIRVAVGYTRPAQAGLVDLLVRALHARGRPCRCVPCPHDNHPQSAMEHPRSAARSVRPTRSDRVHLARRLIGSYGSSLGSARR